MKLSSKQFVARLALTQLLTLLVLVLLVHAWQGQWLSTKSVLVGALVYMVPNLYFAMMVWVRPNIGIGKIGDMGIGKATQSLEPDQRVRQFFRAQTNKFLLTALGFGLVFYTAKSIEPAMLFLGFVVLTVSHILVTHLSVKQTSSN